MAATKVILPNLITLVPMKLVDPTETPLRLCARLLAKGKVNVEERNDNEPVGRMGRP